MNKPKNMTKTMTRAMTKTKLMALLVSLAGWFVAPVASAQPPSSYGTCVACHGKSGGGNTSLGAPALAGQQATYLARQLKQFRDGLRGADASDTYGAQMRAMSLGLSDAAIDELSGYLSTLPVIKPGAPAEADPAVLRTGSDYYQARCGACHGGTGEGNEALQSPNLAILDPVYLERQFTHFQSGLRGSAEGDRLGKQMRLMSNTVSDPAQLDAIIRFIAAQAAL